MKLGNGILWLPLVVTVLLTGVMACGMNLLVRDALREHARLLHYELLAEGGDAIGRAAALSFAQFERRLGAQMLRHPSQVVDLLRTLDEGRGEAVVYDFHGELLTGEWTRPEIAALLSADQIDRRRAIQRLHGDRDFTEDNHARHQVGLDRVPARAHYRLYPTLNAVVGFGQLQRNAGARTAHADGQARQYLQWYGLLGGAIGLGAVLIATGACAWATRRWAIRPLRRIEAALGAGALERSAPGKPQPKADELRAALSDAARARLVAEEERDRLRADFDRDLRAARAAADQAALDTLKAQRDALLARALACVSGAHRGRFARWQALAAQAEAAREPVDVADWLRGAVAGLPETLRARVRPNMADAGRVLADPRLLAEALESLLSNACEAAPPEAGPVSLDAAVTTEGCEIRVVDAGPGIPESIRAVIFNPLFSTRPEAAGLGLPMALEVARLHGATIELRTEPGKGTAFVLRLPALA